MKPEVFNVTHSLFPFQLNLDFQASPADTRKDQTKIFKYHSLFENFEIIISCTRQQDAHSLGNHDSFFNGPSIGHVIIFRFSFPMRSEVPKL